MYRFGTDINNGDMVLSYGEYAATDGIAIDAWDDEGPFADVTSCIPEIPISENEVILNHDILWDRAFVEGLIDYLAEAVRPVTFGPFSTGTYVLKLKAGWKDLCIPMV